MGQRTPGDAGRFGGLLSTPLHAQSGHELYRVQTQCARITGHGAPDRPLREKLGTGRLRARLGVSTQHALPQLAVRDGRLPSRAADPAAHTPGRSPASCCAPPKRRGRCRDLGPGRRGPCRMPPWLRAPFLPRDPPPAPQAVQNPPDSAPRSPQGRRDCAEPAPTAAGRSPGFAASSVAAVPPRAASAPARSSNLLAASSAAPRPRNPRRGPKALQIQSDASEHYRGGGKHIRLTPQ